MKKRRKNKRIIPVFVIILFVVAIAVIGLHKTGIYRFDFFKDVYKKIDFQLNTNELNIPQDALSFSVYDIEQGEYLFYEGDSQFPTVASLTKLFAIDYACDPLGEPPAPAGDGAVSGGTQRVRLRPYD